MSFPFRLPVFTDGITSCSEITGDNPDELCSEKVIADNPEMLIFVKKRAIENGANAILAPTGNATRKKLSEFGENEAFSDINSTITKITAKTSGSSLVGGVVYSSGLFVPPYGEDSFETIYFSYLEKITVLKAANADFILLYNQNNLFDMRAAVLAAKAVDIPVFAVMNVDADGKSESGNDYIAALITLQAMGADAFGIYCTDGTDSQTELIKTAFSHSEIPLIAVTDTEQISEKQLSELAESGASVFIDKAFQRSNKIVPALAEVKLKFNEKEEKDSYAAAIDSEAFFLPDNIELSAPVTCGYDMSDEIIDLDDETINAIYIFLNSTDDAALLADNASMSRLPFIIHTNDAVTLEAALRYYQGRIIVDTCCDIDENVLKTLSKKYGAILY